MIRVCTTRRAHHLPGRFAPQHALRAAAATASRWAPGETITVGFLQGSYQALMEEAVAAAKEWMRYANLNIVFTPSAPACARISTVQDGSSWSMVGKACLLVSDQTVPTLNLGWPDDYARTLHELGHLLDLVHEDQTPLARLPWDRPKVYAFFGAPPNNWTQAEVDEQVLDVDAEPLTNGGFDASSIMAYAVPADLLTDPSRAIPQNEALSAGDKLFVSLIYPAQPAPVPLPVSPPTPAPPLVPPPAVTPPQPGGFMSNLTAVGQNLINGLGWVRGEVSKEIDLASFATTVAMAELSHPAEVAAGGGVGIAGKAVLANADKIFPNPGFRGMAVQLLTDFFGAPPAPHFAARPDPGPVSVTPAVGP